MTQGRYLLLELIVSQFRGIKIMCHVKSPTSKVEFLGINQSPKGYLKSAFLSIPNPASWELQSLHVLKLKISIRGLL